MAGVEQNTVVIGKTLIAHVVTMIGLSMVVLPASIAVACKMVDIITVHIVPVPVGALSTMDICTEVRKEPNESQGNTDNAV